ncbi:uncharacterized protein LOC142581855 [Dermacentor variabilis]|uniref:uncharacterized protein LOC142581855 n=1 Tax=Dermacentor variabilis TaxID=34621 RepID=UPI003F5B236B
MESQNDSLEPCQSSREPCPDCGSPIRASKLSAHRRELCSKRQVRCSRHCGLSPSADRLRDHDCVQELRSFIEYLERMRDELRHRLEYLQQYVHPVQRQAKRLPAGM